MPTNNSFDNMSDIELVKNFQERGDKIFISLLYQRHLDALLSMAIIILKDRTSAEDMVQSTFITVLNKISRFKCLYEKGVKAWLMTMLVNACKSCLRDEERRQHREKVASEEKSTPDLNRRTEKDELLETVLSELKTLPEKYRIPLHLHYQQNMPYKEVALILSIPEKTILTQARRGIAKLREQLDKAGVTASVLIVAGVLKSAPLEAASLALKQGIGALSIQDTSVSQRMSILKSSSSPSPASLLAPGAKWFVACLFLAIGSYVGVKFFKSHETGLNESPTQVSTSGTPFSLSWPFNSPELPPELKSLVVPGQDLRFKYIANGGRDGGGIIEAQTDLCALWVDTPEDSFPFKVSYWTGGRVIDNVTRYSNIITWLKFEVSWFIRDASIVIPKARLRDRLDWYKCESIVTRNAIFQYRYISGVKLLTGFYLFEKMLDRKLIIILTKGSSLDDLDVRSCGEDEIPKLEGFISELKNLKMNPSNQVGEVKVPWPKTLKSPFPGRRKPKLLFERKINLSPEE